MKGGPGKVVRLRNMLAQLRLHLTCCSGTCQQSTGGGRTNEKVSHQTHFTKLRNRLLQAAGEGRSITGSTLLPTHVEVMDYEPSDGIIGFSLIMFHKVSSKTILPDFQ